MSTILYYVLVLRLLYISSICKITLLYRETAVTKLYLFCKI
ncbi:hypothetical protein HMPREF0673_00995 [Leyella stercorea DSM 18206]|uniref:Uncharacterized protein n=1 Tax=Leyella stercorea DSM 18206 TaxID=1002367 RepID=G6AWJ8_9BACT|nr:hypothetical protein HMPREF0673_00995 [Leyella stercorea DSM 18206]